MTRPASLVGDNPDRLTVLRRVVSHNVLTITIVVSIFVMFVFEKEVMPYVRYEGILIARIVIYGLVAAFVILAMFAQATVRRRARFIDHLATYIRLRGKQRFVDRTCALLVRKSLHDPAAIPTLEMAYQSLRQIVLRAGYHVPSTYAALLKR